MFRDPFLNDNGAQKRVDIVLAEAENDATCWVSAQTYQCLCVSIFPAWLDTAKVPHAACGGTIHDFPRPDSSCCEPCCPEETHICIKPEIGAEGLVVLESKFGGRPDCTATIVQVWELDGSSLPFDYDELTGGYVVPREYCDCRGFFRLRVVDYVGPVRLSIERVPGRGVL